MFTNVLRPSLVRAAGFLAFWLVPWIEQPRCELRRGPKSELGAP
jgi:hypothetical protein